MNLWLTGRYCDDEVWEILGVYDCREKAVNRCKLRNDFVMGDLVLNHDQPEERVPMTDQVYPLIELENKK